MAFEVLCALTNLGVDKLKLLADGPPRVFVYPSKSIAEFDMFKVVVKRLHDNIEYKDCSVPTDFDSEDEFLLNAHIFLSFAALHLPH